MIGRRSKSDLDGPLPRVVLKSCDRNVLAEPVVDKRSQAPGGWFVADQAGEDRAQDGSEVRLAFRAPSLSSKSMTIQTPDKTDMAALALAERNGWPVELRALIEKYPRENWEGHENLGQMAQFWLSRHAMFRELGASIAQGTEKYQSAEITDTDFAAWFAPRLQFMLEQLHAHHHIEDHHYFPIFRDADARLARGFDVLEADHAALHEGITRTVAAANALLRSIRDKAASGGERENYATASGALLKGLVRHLDDEEDLIVPLILDRGEDALGVSHG